MKNKIYKLFLLAILAFAILNIFSSPVLADGYSPYTPHIPEDTGLADAVLFNIAAVSAYVSGIGFVGVSRFLSNRIA
jgi:hypothetical protein